MSGRDKAKSFGNLATGSSWENCKDCSRPQTIPDLQRSVRETGIRWLVAHPDDSNVWPAEFAISRRSSPTAIESTTCSVVSICAADFCRPVCGRTSFLLDARQQTLNVRVSHMQTSPQSSIDLHGIKKLRSGKVREVFDLGETLLFVVTDRISAFDVILPDPISYKGAVLNQISAFWFNRFDDVRNHFVTARFDEFPKELQPFREPARGAFHDRKKDHAVAGGMCSARLSGWFRSEGIPGVAERLRD